MFPNILSKFGEIQSGPTATGSVPSQTAVELMTGGDFEAALRELNTARDLHAKADELRGDDASDGEGQDERKLRAATLARADRAASVGFATAITRVMPQTSSKPKLRRARRSVAARRCNMGACCAALGFDGVAGLHLCNALPGLPEAGERPEDGERFAAACHNFGLVALRQGRYESAFQYLARALPYFGMRSRIWLRLAMRSP